LKTSVFAIIITLISSLLLGTLPALLDQTVKADQGGSRGFLEIECNMADVDLNVCPLDKFERKTIRKFFGLFTSYQDSCIGEELFLGTTPIELIELPEGKYVLLIPLGYVFEDQALIEFSISGLQKTFLFLNLIKRHEAYGK
jgi:hypothetical protein